MANNIKFWPTFLSDFNTTGLFMLFGMTFWLEYIYHLINLNRGNNLLAKNLKMLAIFSVLTWLVSIYVFHMIHWLEYTTINLNRQKLLFAPFLAKTSPNRKTLANSFFFLILARKDYIYMFWWYIPYLETKYSMV